MSAIVDLELEAECPKTCRKPPPAPTVTPPLHAGLGFSLAAIHSEFCESTSRRYFLRGLRVKETMPGSREVREGKKSAKGLR